ncbi:energy-coupling factor transport system ATP-binding protein [Branchiibius hedensis]|uniref:Energy-coupling factor transport system ATP-binding protein n=1 Tax=Branchiibius hedensis TaxID=672460 RepID=A0A2Y8ZMI0_9MICO|nr:ATP-binding cassette domain-containing protein [Branchiibius hedensis]PWJ24805.1 energy-coupling factor transport system ATP-binding protein [Branchiibius hedensis]SSA33621.1 energy-coupling factor transport system ATP-binding protein [Branchiibius hedensis]
MNEIVRFDRVSLAYEGTHTPTLIEVDLSVEMAELVLIVGRTGSGKSTFLTAINGLMPHFTGGTVTGTITVAGRSTAEHRPRDLADVIGYVGQDPAASFITDTVEEELAYGMEQRGLAPEVMRKRVEETLDVLGIAELRNRPLSDLSGGQQQRVAIGAALTMQPQVLLLDEPTSALDPNAAEDVLATITRLVHDLAVTVIVAEHRIERVIPYADRVIHVGTDGRVRIGEPAAIMAVSDVAPPLVELGRLAGWTPLPLSVRDARRQAGRMRAAAADIAAPLPKPASSAPILTARSIGVTYGRVPAVRGVDLEFFPGQVTALMGRNGSGKSSLLWALQGSGAMDHGSVRVDGQDPRSLSAGARRELVGLVPQTAADLLYLASVGAELRAADSAAGAAQGTARALLDQFAPGVPDDRHPRDLSEGQRLSLVLAIQLAARPHVVLLDEPTRGLDYDAKAALRRTVRRLADEGAAVLIASHDVEFVAAATDRVVLMAQGEVIADGSTPDVVLASAAYAPQIAKIMAPVPVLTLEQVEPLVVASR